MQHLEQCIDQYLSNGYLRHLALRVGRGETVIYETFRGAGVDRDTLFDMASVTKILATTSLALIALDQRLISLHQPVSHFFPCPEDKEAMNVYHLLTHTMGFGHKSLNTMNVTKDNVADTILKIPCDVPIGEAVLYSCPGFILLGKILEQVWDAPLDQLFKDLVCAPLGMNATGFCPTERQNIVNANGEESLRGTVNDYNCRHLGGVAGNAGVFSNLTDMTAYAKALLQGFPLVSSETFALATQNHTPTLEADRALGYLYVTPRYEQTGGLFPTGSFGHCGHTGQSVFVNRESGLYVIVLSDATKSTYETFGHSHYETVKQFRADLHAAIRQDLRI